MACKGACLTGVALAALGRSQMASKTRDVGQDKERTAETGLAVVAHLGPADLKLQLPDVHLGRSDTGFSLWVSGLLLASVLAEEGENLVRGRSVLELGAGISAVPTLVAAQQSPRHCVATDYCEEIVASIRSNLQLNGAKAEAKILDWEMAAANPPLEKWDLVLFADAVYTEEMGSLLARCLDALVAPHGEILGALPENRIGIAEFVRKMAAIGFHAEEVPVSASLKTAIDEGKVLQHARLSREECLKMLSGLPAQASILVRWRRKHPAEDKTKDARNKERIARLAQQTLGTRPDESERIWAHLAAAMAKKESQIRISEGFEIWE